MSRPAKPGVYLNEINNREYLSFRTKEVQVFIEKDLIQEIHESGGVIKVLMGDYGAWDLTVS